MGPSARRALLPAAHPSLPPCFPSSRSTPAASTDECEARCRGNSGCSFYIYTTDGLCVLKDSFLSAADGSSGPADFVRQACLRVGSGSSGSAPTPPTDSGDASMPRQLLDLVNGARAQAGLGALCLNAKLNAAAQKHSDDQAAHQRMGHTGSDGSDMGTRIVEREGYSNWKTIAENAGVGYEDVAAAFKGWMESEGHRANILNAAVTQMGAGATRSGGDGRLYWTQVRCGSRGGCGAGRDRLHLHAAASGSRPLVCHGAHVMCRCPCLPARRRLAAPPASPATVKAIGIAAAADPGGLGRCLTLAAAAHAGPQLEQSGRRRSPVTPLLRLIPVLPL